MSWQKQGDKVKENNENLRRMIMMQWLLLSKDTGYLFNARNDKDGSDKIDDEETRGEISTMLATFREVFVTEKKRCI